MRKPPLETKDPQSFEKLELLYTLLKTGEKGALALCICNSPAYRRQLETELAQRLKKDRIALHTLELKPGIISIVRAIKEKIDRLSPEPGWRLALSISGIENTISEAERETVGKPQALQVLNQQRDSFLFLPHPMALWLPEWVVQLLLLKAPDFWLVRTSVWEFSHKGKGSIRSRFCSGATHDIGILISGVIVGIGAGILLAAILDAIKGSRCPACNEKIKRGSPECPHCNASLQWGG